jgi:hypothetical protein
VPVQEAGIGDDSWSIWDWFVWDHLYASISVGL